jgi:hypothetical protein
VIGAVIAPLAAAIGAIAAVLADCTIEVERTEPGTGTGDEGRGMRDGE